MRWSRPGTDEVTVWKDMLECNYASPFDGIRGLDGADRTFDETVATMICMERTGYAYSERGQKVKVCERYKSNASCLPGAAIPLPEAGRRLNGGYCKKYPQSRACVP
ncbi:hypothetical protein [Lysobacter sp.]|uniref:hypothetical protein n=1 Tax=Lysobacter sp. TaxID=72226 RepID=UPI002D223E73|nr:hypothetical protein [Lysobacter sp.]HZX78223.1 hypothetical protein [Lysobacter sp.]